MYYIVYYSIQTFYVWTEYYNEDMLDKLQSICDSCKALKMKSRLTLKPY